MKYKLQNSDPQPIFIFGSGLNADVTYTKLTSWFSRSTIFKWFDRYWNVNDLTDVTDVTDVIDMTDVTDVAISTPRRILFQIK